MAAAGGRHRARAPRASTRSRRAEGELNRGARYDRTIDEYGRIARRQLVFGLQVHVAVRGADRALAVYNALRSYLPELLALAANAPFYGGEDSGLATVRPKLNELLPRQGVPPAIPSWDELRRRPALGRARRRRARGRASGGGSCGRTRAGERSRCACRTRRRRSTTPSASSRSCTRWSHWLAARHDAGRAAAGRADVADRGEPLAGAARAAATDCSPTWRPGAVAPARERLHALVEAVDAGGARARRRARAGAYARARSSRGGHERQRAVAPTAACAGSSTG